MEKSRDQIAEELRAEGYNITVESGVIIISTDDPQFTEDIYHQMLLNKGYNCSYGMRLSGAAAEAHKKVTSVKTKPTVKKTKEEEIDNLSLAFENLKVNTESSSKKMIAGQISLF